MARKDYIVWSGNVFEDFGHPRPAEALAKAELARKIAEVIAKRRLTQAAISGIRGALHATGTAPNRLAPTSRAFE